MEDFALLQECIVEKDKISLERLWKCIVMTVRLGEIINERVSMRKYQSINCFTYECQKLGHRILISNVTQK